jgi:hypothetical protein
LNVRGRVYNLVGVGALFCMFEDASRGAGSCLVGNTRAGSDVPPAKDGSAPVERGCAILAELARVTLDVVVAK